MSRRLALTAIVALGCGGHVASTAAPGSGSDPVVVTAPPPPPPVDAGPPLPLDQDLPRFATRALAMLGAIAAALEAAHDDCAAAARRLDAIRGEYADVVAANAEIVQHDRKAELARALAPQQAALDAAGAAVFRAHTLSACAQDAAFAAALDRALGAP